MTKLWDVVVIGAGMGGSAAAAALAEAGLSVLVLESGKSDTPRPNVGLLTRIRESAKGGVIAAGRWPNHIVVGSKGNRQRILKPVLGHGPGGSGRLYGAALTRMRRSTFQDDTQISEGASDAPLPNSWPVSFDEFLPAYDKAEALLGVRGSRDPLDEDQINASPLRSPPPVCPREAQIADDVMQNGYHPFRLPVGIKYKPGCTECQGHGCERKCKSDSFTSALSPIIQEANVQFSSGTTVREIRRAKVGFETLAVREGGCTEPYSSRVVVLAAGALNTPRLLMRSKSLWSTTNLAANLGSGLMFHITDIIAVFDRRKGALYGPRKTTCIRDFYEDGGTPLGEIQSLGFDVQAGLIRSYLVDEAGALGFDWIPGLSLATALPAIGAAHFFKEAALFATILEDLPYASNRVLDIGDLHGPDQIHIHYAAASELTLRAKRLRKHVRSAFSPNRTFFLSRLCRPNYGHPMGTCRMGSAPEHSVTDKYGRVWGQDGIYVADASVFPSSGGTNPSLTIVAHALRVADQIVSAS